MTTITTSAPSPSAFLQEAEMFAELYGKQQPAFLNLRRDAIAAFTKLGIPTGKHEEWKYLNLSGITTAGYRTVSPTDTQTFTAKEAEQYRLPGKKSVLVVVENGRINSAASSMNDLPSGIKIGSLSDFLGQDSVQSHLFQHADFVNEALVAMNTMLCYEPVVILVEKNAKIELPVQLAFVAVAGAEPLSIPARVLVVMGDQSECTVIESYHTHGDGAPTFTNAVSEVVVGKGARYFGTKVQAEADTSKNISYHKVNMARDSYQHLTTVTLGGLLVRNNLHIRLDDVNINSYLNGLYVLNGDQVVDNHTLVDHAMPNCYSNELYKGIIDGHATGVFNGKIWVRQDAQKTNAYQSNKNLLLSNEASMNTKPQLEIYADDVKCSHGATTGQLDDEALFYLRARGIGEETARALLNHAFAADVIEQVENEELRASLLQLLEKKLK